MSADDERWDSHSDFIEEEAEWEEHELRIQLSVRDLVIMPFDTINDQPVVRIPKLITIDGDEFVEWYVKGEGLAYTRCLASADGDVVLNVDLDNLDLS